MEIQLPDRVENIVGKGEIARYEQFLLFPQCFQKLLLLMCQNEYLWSKGLNVFSVLNGPWQWFSNKSGLDASLPQMISMIHSTTHINKLLWLCVALVCLFVCLFFPHNNPCFSYIYSHYQFSCLTYVCDKIS